MTALLDFTIQSDAFTVGEVLDVDAATQIDLTQFVPIGENLVPYFWVEAKDNDEFESDVLESPHVAELDRLDRVTGRTLYRVIWRENINGLLSSFKSHDLAVRRARTHKDEWTFKLISADREVFADFQADCHKKGLPLTVRRLSDKDDYVNALYGLTKKQLEALLLAFDAGYYDSEVNVTLADLSEGLDISQQALSSRLKRGTRTLISNTVAVDED